MKPQLFQIQNLFKIPLSMIYNMIWLFSSYDFIFEGFSLKNWPFLVRKLMIHWKSFMEINILSFIFSENLHNWYMKLSQISCRIGKIKVKSSKDVEFRNFADEIQKSTMKHFGEKKVISTLNSSIYLNLKASNLKLGFFSKLWVRWVFLNKTGVTQISFSEICFILDKTLNFPSRRTVNSKNLYSFLWPSLDALLLLFG